MVVKRLKMGSRAPDFELPGVDGRNHGLKEFQGKNAIIIIFSCNHCPYVVAYEDRMVEIQRQYKPMNVQIVAINSNETVHFPEDSFTHMIERAKSKNFNFPYLRDEDQSVAKAYGPERTPEVFLFDRNNELRYHGAIDDNYQNPAKVKHNYLREALDDILSGKQVRTKETQAVGCSIKWL